MGKNKYNREIMKASMRWTEREVSLAVGLLKEVLILSRLRNKKAFTKIMKASLI